MATKNDLKPKPHIEDDESFDVTAHPKYRRAREHLDNLIRQRDAVQRALETPRVADGRTIDARAGSLIYDGDEMTAPPAVIPSPEEAQLLRDTQRLSGELVALSRAIKKQQAIVEQLAREIGAEICQRPDVVAQYRANVQRIAAAALELAHAAKAERVFRDRLERGNVATGYLQPAPFPLLGDPDDPNSRIAYWLREARAAGLLNGNGKH